MARKRRKPSIAAHPPGRQPELKELARSVSSALSAEVHRLASLPGYEEDDILTSRGPETYEKMLCDSQVGSCVDIKKLSVLGQEWQVHPKKKLASNPLAREIAAVCGEELEGLEGGWFDTADGILDCVARGRSLSELVWAPRPGGRWGLRAIKAKNPRWFGFDCDDFGNLKHLTYRPDGSGEVQTLPPEKFVIAVYKGRYGSWRGQSDLRRAYRPWFIKEQLMRFWPIYLERFGAPMVLGKYPRQTSKAEREAFEGILRRIHLDAGALLPADLEIEFKEATRGATSFREALDFMDDAIARAILGVTLTTGEGRRSGSLALGKVHQATQRLFFHALQKLLETVVEVQILRRLTLYNYAVPLSFVPEFSVAAPEEAPEPVPEEADFSGTGHVEDTLGEELARFKARLRALGEARRQRAKQHGGA